MQITKCDLCNKTIKSKTGSLYVSVGGMFSVSRWEICLDCGKPIKKFLISKKLIKNEKASKKIK